MRVVANEVTFSCPNGEADFRCGTDSVECVSDLLICDGIPDCHNAADESPSLCDGKFSFSIIEC
jgi:Low-density lipoprotein receptor domain class A